MSNIKLLCAGRMRGDGENDNRAPRRDVSEAGGRFVEAITID